MTKRAWHKNFINYMKFIVNHENYKGLACIKNSEGEVQWLAPKISLIGKRRIQWALSKAKSLNIKIEPGVYAKVMLAVHPTKIKPCQICGREMYLNYFYPSSSLIKSLRKKFEISVDQLTSINEITALLIKKGINDTLIVKYLDETFNLRTTETNLARVILECESKSRSGISKMLGPGAMSNFPDRFDGFHSYNRCCRAIQDTGRSKDNLRSYNKDRRAYELWSDGNIHAANQFMVSEHFKGTSADHIGPISLGFKHDSLNLKQMNKSANSTKRDRLLAGDVCLLKNIEKEYGENMPSVMSWFSELIWEDIKGNTALSQPVLDKYQNILKSNMFYFMLILSEIYSECGEKGKEFLIDRLLRKKYEYFGFDHEFDENGVITCTGKRRITDSTRKEIGRLEKIAFESLKDFSSKVNRRKIVELDKEEESKLLGICRFVKAKKYENAYDALIELNKIIQIKLLGLLRRS